MFVEGCIAQGKHVPLAQALAKPTQGEWTKEIKFQRGRTKRGVNLPPGRNIALDTIRHGYGYGYGYGSTSVCWCLLYGMPNRLEVHHASYRHCPRSGFITSGGQTPAARAGPRRWPRERWRAKRVGSGAGITQVVGRAGVARVNALHQNTTLCVLKIMNLRCFMVQVQSK